jgi:hypothetical protein
MLVEAPVEHYLASLHDQHHQPDQLDQSDPLQHRPETGARSS